MISSDWSKARFFYSFSSVIDLSSSKNSVYRSCSSFKGTDIFFITYTNDYSQVLVNSTSVSASASAVSESLHLDPPQEVGGLALVPV